jgi:hypothetical protein
MPFSPQTYQRLWIASLLVTMLLAAWTGISAVGGDRLGLSPQTMAWMGIVAGVLGMLLGFLPPLQKTPSANEDAVRQVQTARHIRYAALVAQEAQQAPQAQQIPPAQITPPPGSRLTQPITSAQPDPSSRPSDPA